MTAIFLKLLNMSITASWLVLAVVVLRLLLKKAPKAITCALWALVAIRLLCPFSIESMFSLIPSAEPVSPEIVYTEKPTVNTPAESPVQTVTPNIAEPTLPTAPIEPTVPAVSTDPVEIALTVASAVWILGIVCMTVYALVSYLRLRKKVAEAVEIEQNVYLCDHVDTPFILGIFRPRIYLPSAIGETDMRYVLAHERAHLRRRDHWWKPLGFALLTVYWFNPVLWVAYVLLCRDIELACDERVIRDMGVEDKKAYTSALLNCSIPRKMIAACPLAFGEVGVKARIKSVLHYKKPAFWIILVAVIATIAVAVGFLTDPKEDVRDADIIYRAQIAYGPTANGVHASAESEKGRKLLGLYEEPLRKFDSADELDAFKTEFSDIFVMDATYNAISSFNSASKKYDADFFAKNALFVWYAQSTSGTWRYTVDSVVRDGEKLTINIAVENAIEVNDYRGWFLFVSVEKEAIKGCTDFAVQTNADGVLSYRQAPYFSAKVAHAGIPENMDIYNGSLNTEKLFVDGPEHLPIYEFENTAELDAFKTKFTDALSLTEGDGEIPSFAEVTASYDDAFFEEYFLLAIYRRTSCRDDRYAVAGVYVGDTSLTVHVQQITYGEVQEETGMFFLVAVDNKYAPYCTEFDAYMVYKSVENPIVGVWSNGAAGEASVVFKFNADGTGEKNEPQGENVYISSYFTYEAEDGILKIAYGKSLSNVQDPLWYEQYTYTIKDGYLTLQMGTEELVLFAPMTDSKLLGTWQTEGTSDATGFTLTFYADGRGFESGGGNSRAFTYATNGETLWVTYTADIPDGEVSVFGNGLSLGGECAYTFDGDTVTIAQAYQTDRNVVFTKVYPDTEETAAVDTPYEATLAHVNYISKNDAIFTGALNSDKMAISSVRHLPIRKFDSKEALDAFKAEFADDLSKQSRDEVPSFEAVSAKYDEDFFASHTLFIVYVQASSGSCRYEVGSVYNDGKNFAVHAEVTRSPRTADMRGWFLCVAVDKDSVKSCTSFDADLNALTDTEQLVGTWKTVASNMGGDYMPSATKASYYTFRADGTGTQIDGEDEIPFTYTTEGRLMTIRLSNNAAKHFVYRISGDMLSFSGEYNSDVQATLQKTTIVTDTMLGDALFTAKLFQNGSAATVHVTDTGDQTVKLSVCKNGIETWSTTLGTAHAGWASYHLCRRGEQDYILEYTPTMYQGAATYTYTLFYLNGNGDAVKRASDTLTFDTNDLVPIDVDIIFSFVDGINDLLGESDLIVSTLNGNKQIGSETAPVHLTETLSWLDDGGVQYSDGDTLREKLTKYIAANTSGVRYKSLAKADAYDVEVLAKEDSLYTYTEFMLKVGEKEKQFSGKCFWLDISIHAPTVHVEDLTDDGYPEIIVVFECNSGTCTYQEDIHVFDSRTLEEYEVEKVYETIGNYVPITIDDKAFYLQTTDGVRKIDKMVFYPDYEPENLWNRIDLTSMYRYSVSDGVLRITMQCQIAPSAAYGAVVANYAFENGKFVYDTSTFVAP
ncbi:MAG: hypothetical protein IJX64_06785 [Clostridia bacterium]|nr:hypothetical protein [Clostridia bacterium]